MNPFRMRITVLRSSHCGSCSVTMGLNREHGRRSGSNGYGLSHTTFEERYHRSISTGCTKRTNCIASGFSSSARSFLKSIADYSSSSLSLSASASYSSSFSSTSFAISRSLSQFIIYCYLGVRTVKSVSLPEMLASRRVSASVWKFI